MPRPRKHIRAEEKIAALHYRCTLLEDLIQARRTGVMSADRLPYDDMKKMSAAQVCSLFQWHHEPIPHEAGGPDVHWNLTPVMIKQHREIEKRGAAVRAKVKRIRAKQSPSWGDHGIALGPVEDAADKIYPRKRKWPSRPLPSRSLKRKKQHGRSRDERHRG